MDLGVGAHPSLPARHASHGRIALDITERKLADEELRRSERIYRGIGESIDYGIWICDPQGCNTYSSPSFLDLLGITQEQCSPLGWIEALPPDEAPATAEAWHACVRTGSLWEREHRFKDRDGEWHATLARGVPIRDERGEVQCWAGINLDLTRLRQTEEAARRGEERLRLALRGASAGVWQLDVATGELSLSDELLRLYGIEGAPPRDVASWLRHVHRDDRERVEAELRRLLSASDDEIRRELRIVHPLQGERALLDMARIERDDRGTAVRVTGIQLDISERAAAEHALRGADRRKDEFLATLAHELRNPLAPIANGLELLRIDGVRSKTTARAVEMMERQVGQMTRLVDDLLEISRITRDMVELRTERVAIEEVIASAVETSRPQIEARGHQLELELCTEPLWVWADPVRLTQVLGNLLGNAAKYTDDGGHIRVSAWRKDGEIGISVADDGIGIPQALLPRVFDLFAQLHRDHKASQGGLGIGLSLARSLVERHGGRIEARSAGPGAGSEFIVRLPAAADVGDAPARESAPQRSPTQSLLSRSVLVVDDSVDAADSLAGLLRLRGHRVEVAYDGPAAVATARACKPDVVVLDIGLPGDDGYEIARTLRRERGLERALLVALTGYGQPEDRERSRNAGFDAHLVKPVALPELEALLRTSGRRHGG